MSAEQKLKELRLELPPAPRPVGSYVAAIRSGNLIFTAGQIPTRGGVLVAAGKVPDEVPIEAAQAAARQAVLNALAAIRPLAGNSLDNIMRVVRLNVFVNSSPHFIEQAKAANGASDLLVEVFGDAGRHTRAAIGAAELPLNAPVELDLIVEVK